MNTFNLYFKAGVVTFATSGNAECSDVRSLAPGEAISPTNLCNFFDNNKTVKHVCFVSDSPERSFKAFCEQFIPVEAAGGVVRNDAGEILMMKRNGWWDLPKGHVEAGEGNLEAALREVEEETGLGGVRAGELITTTRHFYNMNGRWELKRTWWYAMRYSGVMQPIPQTEEDITEVVWLDESRLSEALSVTYSTIRDVLSTYALNENIVIK